MAGITITCVMSPTEYILAQRKLGGTGLAERYMTSTVRRHMDKYVKKDTGVLKNTAVEGQNTITFVQPYAAKQYYTPNTREGAPTRGPYWDRRMWSADGDAITREMARYVGGTVK